MAVVRSHIKVDSIETNEGGPVQVSFGATIPSGQTLGIQGNASFGGVSTTLTVDVTNFNVGVVTATEFFGDASTLGGLPVVSNAKTVALYVIL